MKYLICGAGGFIGGHLVKSLIDEGHELVCADIKPLENWFQIFEDNQNFSLDLKSYDNCLKVTKNVDYIYNMACNMGGMGFIENNKAECMLSVLINTNLLRACLINKVEKYFFSSSACVYNAKKQKKIFIDGLKEEDAYPAEPEDGYGWEKLFSERMCRHFTEDFNLQTRVARYHNVYGPLGTYDGGREKAPAALSRKIVLAKINNEKEIEVWGDGEQTRSFMYIDDCLVGTKKIFNSNLTDVYNLGSSEQVSINQLIDIIEKIADYKVNRKYLLDKPKGVRGRSSDNNKIKSDLGWEPSIKLLDGLTKTYQWIDQQIKSGENTLKFTKSY
jgi:nucleoside-diphosphate-sugar epimerase